MADYAPYVKALQRCEREVVQLEARIVELEAEKTRLKLENAQLRCAHVWQEQSSEPPTDVCSSCGRAKK